MTPSTTEWVSKAEGDYDVVIVLRRSRKASRHEGITYHCQQCVEKYVKGRLNEAGVAFPKTHDLSRLLKLAASLEPAWQIFESEFKSLSDTALDTRYPGRTAGAAESSAAFDTCRRFRDAARLSLGLKP